MENDLDFTQPHSPDRKFFPGFGALSKQKVESISKKDKVGIWDVNNFTLKEIDLMLSPAYQGLKNEIPNNKELLEIATILRAKKALKN